MLFVFFAKTKLGVAMQAASQNQMAAYYMGIPVRRVNSLIWALSGIVAAIAGILFASKNAIDPGTGLLGIKAVEGIYAGSRSSFAVPGQLSWLEREIHDFQKYLASRLTKSSFRNS